MSPSSLQVWSLANPAVPQRVLMNMDITIVSAPTPSEKTPYATSRVPAADQQSDAIRVGLEDLVTETGR